MSGITIKGDVTFSDLKTGKEIKLADRNAIIEECARVVEDQLYGQLGCDRVAAAIRALKDKP